MCIPRFLKRSFVALAILGTLTVFPAGVAHGAANASEAAMAREIANDINAERAARGLSRLPYDTTYAAGAQRVAESNRDRPCHACHSTEHPSGEVVWWGSDYGSSGSTIWWMGSPSHRALLLAPDATKIGVGVACDGTAHDAVGWIETTSVPATPPASPVATKPGTGTRCRGGPSSTPTTAGAPVSAGPSSTTAPRRATSTTAASRTSTTAGTRRTTTTRVTGATPTTVPRRSIFAAPADVQPDAVSSVPVGTEEALALRTVSGARTVAVTTGMGPFGTVLLLLVFAGSVAVARLTHRR